MVKTNVGISEKDKYQEKTRFVTEQRKARVEFQTGVTVEGFDRRQKDFNLFPFENACRGLAMLAILQRALVGGVQFHWYNQNMM